mmetsp:Transcript_40696/g.68099  ORF Transcript_40696/g.68099 Transcript_40696/m.68099 type:complete len:89 (+) Transcript_40696:2669-2935(+)
MLVLAQSNWNHTVCKCKCTKRLKCTCCDVRRVQKGCSAKTGVTGLPFVVFAGQLVFFLCKSLQVWICDSFRRGTAMPQKNIVLESSVP